MLWDQKVKGQGQDGIKCAGSSTFWACWRDVLRILVGFLPNLHQWCIIMGQRWVR